MREILILIILLGILKPIPVFAKSEFNSSGFIQTWFNSDFKNQNNFSLFRLRLIFKGDISDKFSYFINISPDPFLKNEQLRDAYLKWKPNENFNIIFGRNKIPYSTDNLRPFFDYEFARRPLHATLNSPYIRDTGVVANLSLNKIQLSIGALKGAENTNNYTNFNLNYIGRLEVSFFDDLTFTAGYYYGSGLKEFANYYNAGLNYKINDLKLDVETSIKQTEDLITGLTAFASYNFFVNHDWLDRIVPSTRYEYLDLAHRITFGMTFFPDNGFNHLKINFEKVIKQGESSLNLSDQLIIQTQVKW